MAALFTPPLYVKDLFEQMDIIGVGSLPIVLLTGFFIGAVMVLQTASQFVRFGETSLTGDVVALALVRELGPAITGLLVAGRNASGMASELGSMLVTEQVDAMRAMGTDPDAQAGRAARAGHRLVLPLLTAMADFVGLVGGFVIAYFTLRIGSRWSSGPAPSTPCNFPTSCKAWPSRWSLALFSPPSAATRV